MDEPGPTSFEDGVSSIMMVTEELKRSCLNDSSVDNTIARVLEWQGDLDGITQRVDFLLRLTLDSPGDDVRNDLFGHVAQRAVDVALSVLKRCTAENDKEVPDLEMQGQAAIARIAELNVVLNGMLMQHDKQRQRPKDGKPIDNSTTIVDLYTSYQRQLLRQRSKPAIAQLATWRKTRGSLVSQQEQEDEEDEEQLKQPHTRAITVILGQASALLHPLILWLPQIPPENTPLTKMCRSAIAVLDEQAQTLTKTVCNWFNEDRNVEEWMSKTTEKSLEEQQSHSVNLAELDALLEEMSFACQVLARYELLTKQTDEPCQTILSQELLPEWTWRYAALERFLSTQQWHHALQMASPVDIVMGASIKVPSVVEDAQYLSTRALERASSTLSLQAMGTVAHAVTHDVWSTDDAGGGGVHNALIQQRGCWAPPPEDKSPPGTAKKVASPPNSSNNNTFASALLDALDDDLGPNKNNGASNVKTAPSRPPKAPSSGGLLGGLAATLGGGQQEQQQIRIDTQLCNLNGIHSASVACSSLVTLLESLLEENAPNDGKETNGSSNKSSSTSMIELAREELMRYDRAYQEDLTSMIQQLLSEWCGSRGQSLQLLREFFSNETYRLDATTFRQAESDDRLERDMMKSFRSGPIIRDLDKCDTQVTTLVCRELSSMVSNLVLETLWNQPGSAQQYGSELQEHPRRRRFNDWGSLLLSKQVRLLSQFFVGLIENSINDNEQSSYKNTTIVMDQWEKLSQVVTLLQLEKPSDFLAYQDTCGLTVEELDKTLSLRSDFSSDAISSTTQAYSKAKQQQDDSP